MTHDSTTTHGSSIVQISLMMENRVGSFGSVVSLLRDAQVEVLGFSLVDSVDITIARTIVSDPDTAIQRFLERGITHSVCDVVVVELARGANGLSDCLKALHEAETNIHFSYPLLVRANDFPLLALHLEDAEFAKSVLHQRGFRTLAQEDLSR